MKLEHLALLACGYYAGHYLGSRLAYADAGKVVRMIHEGIAETNPDGTVSLVEEDDFILDQRAIAEMQ